MRVLRFRVDGRALAMDLRKVREVCPLVRLKSAPGAPPWLAGLLDLHGQLLPVVDASRLLGGEGVPQIVGARLILLQTGATERAETALTTLALRVTGVDGVGDADPGSAWSPPQGLPGMPFLSEMLQGHPDGVLMFDPVRLVAAHAGLLHGPALLGLPQTEPDHG